eukprot:g570.t1
MRGKIVLLTGARVKIGFQCGLKLLRAGATLVATTRFPKDCAKRYAKEEDFSEWKDRLMIFGLDLRDLVALENFCSLLIEKLPRLDVIVNNACQTIRRPVAYYSHLMPGESMQISDLPKDVRRLLHQNQEYERNQASSLKIMQSPFVPSSTISAMSSAEKSQIALSTSDSLSKSKMKEMFPKHCFDVNGQQIDLREKTSWTMKLEEVGTPEIAEVFAINTLAPFILNGKLKKLFQKDKNGAKFIVNVSAMEGKFYRRKSANHPHTNMAKAALNMMTRTSAVAYAKEGIFMNSVDTGWVNDEDPLPKATKKAKLQNFQTPIDEIDAAARVLDFVFTGINGGGENIVYGKFLKDYGETEW